MALDYPPSPELRSILDQIDTEARDARLATLSQCEDCESVDVQDMCGSVAEVHWVPCVRHAYAKGDIIPSFPARRAAPLAEDRRVAPVPKWGYCPLHGTQRPRP